MVCNSALAIRNLHIPHSIQKSHRAQHWLPVMDAAQLTGWVKPGEIWQLNFWIWILQAEGNYVRIQHSIKIWTPLRSFYCVHCFSTFPSRKSIPLFSLSDINILRDSVPDLKNSTRLVTVDILNWLRRKFFCLRK